MSAAPDPALVARFLPGARWSPLAPDASVRTFYRVTPKRGASAVLLVDKSPRANERMADAAALFGAASVPVPRVLDRDDTLGALLFEDFGDTLLADATTDANERREHYAAAGRIAGRIAGAGNALLPEHPGLTHPTLSRERLRAELAYFLVHDVVARRGIEDRGLLAELGAAFDTLATSCAALPPAFAHRDFHARNLLVRADGSLGVLDFQDALSAPPGYDIQSLLKDPYVTLDDAARRAAAEAYASELALDPSELDGPASSAVGLQRLLKAIGTYANQCRRPGRERFAEYLVPAEERSVALLDTLDDELAGMLRPLLARLGFADAAS